MRRRRRGLSMMKAIGVAVILRSRIKMLRSKAR